MSKSVVGKVLKIDLNTTLKKRDGGSYKGYRITYETTEGEIQKIEKHENSLKYGAGPIIKETLVSLQPGDDFTIYMDKNDEGYLDVVGLAKGHSEDAVAEAALRATNSSPSRGNSTGGGKVVSTYETPEERKLKQRLIVRQAALNQSLAFNKSGTVVADITNTAEQFEEWVYRGL